MYIVLVAGHWSISHFFVFALLIKWYGQFNVRSVYVRTLTVYIVYV